MCGAYVNSLLPWVEMRRLSHYSNEGTGEHAYTGREISQGNLRGRPYVVCVF